ncbi:hypothetical protein Verru16b_00164 [Lacunisphaera limnophila]|uniref:Gram-negative bacterial tonB protein n=1 Tax=Lacunisphaera limnophila TaxID=1838286 RepID=A0A1I7PHN5_9BACT|nr:hypothetical protein [Lacunisphaera limnophila]AOS43123.1 hypothetical protein Verru16b_00164 [Lacunisphaera limnophila]
MKLSLLPLLTLALAAGACSQHATTPAPSLVAVPAGTLQTAWGAMPTYRSEGLPFKFDRSRQRQAVLPREYRAGDTVVLDVLVSRDGTINDVKVQRSCGTESVDRFMANRFVGARSQLQVAATDPAPYVIRQTFSLGESGPTGSNALMTDGDSKFSDVRPMGTGAKHPADH